MGGRKSYVTVEVDVDIGEISTEDLLSELKCRGDGGDSLNEIYYSLKLGRDDKALELMRKFVCDQTGKIL